MGFQLPECTIAGVDYVQAVPQSWLSLEADPATGFAGGAVLRAGWRFVHRCEDLSARLQLFSSALLPQATALLEADRDLYQALVAERTLVQLAGNGSQPSLEAEHRENMQQAFDRVQAFASTTESMQARALADRFSQAFDAWKRGSEEVVTLARSSSFADNDQAHELSFGTSYERFSAARELIDQMTQQVDSQSAAEVAAAEAAVARDAGIFSTVALVGLVICALLIAFLPGLILKPLLAILARIRDIADGEGDLTKRVEVTSTDEIGQLGQSVNLFLEQLQTLIQQVADSTLQVASASQQMSTIAVTQQQLVSEQYMAIDQVSTAATEMSAAIHEVQATPITLLKPHGRRTNKGIPHRSWSDTPWVRCADWPVM
ncbi:methyl-accepting chemotaxis protein [Pseudomonas sp. OIL-1]|uniref:methyl-accepting chemotaxis protein n=1 Tax=Pseudomonas sp. OIL-1 TaxID=2706126 RepID=UPI002113E023|nr:methyl-accepting chemotaxis protein [Pseudomonas sp. OIL-1]